MRKRAIRFTILLAVPALMMALAVIAPTHNLFGTGPAQEARHVKIQADGGLVSTGIVFAPGFQNLSDARFKTNITPLDNALGTVRKLRGVTYDWRKDVPGMHFSDRRQVGLIAQEVERVLPDLVFTDRSGYKSVAYVNMVPILVEAVKTQQKEIERLQAVETENASLRRQFATMLARFDRMEKSYHAQYAER